MKESYGEGPASHPDPESCVGGREAGGEALTGAHAGQPLSCEIRSFGVPTPLSEAEGHTGSGVTGEPLSDPAQSETLHTRGNSSHGNREVPTPPEGNTGRPEKATSRTSGTHGVGKSEGGVVPKNPSNNGGLVPPAETGREGRPPRGTRPVTLRAGRRAGASHRPIWNVCAKLLGRTGRRSSLPYCTTSPSRCCSRASSRSSAGRLRAPTG